MLRPIAISLSPNTEVADVLLALRLFFSPWLFFQDSFTRLLEQWFRHFFDVSYAVSFSTGRGALLAILHSLNISGGDEVIVQSFTCVAVPNSIVALGARPVYVDIDDSLTLELKDLERKITEKTKAIIVQYTFGTPANMTKIKKIAKKYNIFVIIDYAHVVNNKNSTTLCDAAFFSLGRDKAFSSVFGGVAITNSKELGMRLRSFQKDLKNPSFFFCWQQLFHPIVINLIVLPFYNFFSFGKTILFFLQKLRLLSFPVTKEEKEGKVSEAFIKKFPNVLACLALFQLRRVGRFNKKRQELSEIYNNNLSKKYYKLLYRPEVPFLRFPVLVNGRNNIIEFMKGRGIHLGKWYSEVIDPKGVNFANIYYKKGSCPNAEFVARKIINLPTYPLMRTNDVERIIYLLNKYAENKAN